MPPPEPSATERARGAAARVLARLPQAVQQRLAGAPPDVVDGQRLDPAVQMLLAFHPRDPGMADAVRADATGPRAQLRRDVLSLVGRPTPVGSVEALRVAGAAGPLDARLYRPRDASRPPLVVFFHGGGFVEGDLDTHDEPCRVLCRQAGHAVLSVAYRLAPEHPFPAAYDDAVAAFRWAQAEADRLRADPGRVAVAGDSAGGNLAAGVAQATAADAPPVAQLLIYPGTDHPGDYASRAMFDGYLLPEAVRAAFFEVYAAGADVAHDPRMSPMRGDLAGLAPAFVLTAGFDVLRDEGEAYARALEAAGVPVALFRQADQPHGFINLTSVSPAAARGWTAACRRWRRFVEAHA